MVHQGRRSKDEAWRGGFHSLQRSETLSRYVSSASAFLSLLLGLSTITFGADTVPTPIDQDFVVIACQAENAEVALGLVAVEKATSPRVVMFGKRMIADNGKAALTLRNLATSKGYFMPAQYSVADSTTLTNLIQLDGTSFDTAYINQEIASRAAAVQMLSREAAIASDSDLQILRTRRWPTRKRTWPPLGKLLTT